LAVARKKAHPPEPVSAPEVSSEVVAARRWYALRVFTTQENAVKNYLEGEVKRSAALIEQVGAILVPQETVVEMRDGRKRQRNKITFPGYLFIEMLLSKETRHLIDGAPGTMGFADGTQDPQPLRAEEVDRILGRVEERRGQITVEIPFQIGDKVKITDGPFKDLVGSIKELNQEKRRLKVLVTVFNSSTPVEVDFLQVTTNFTT